MMRKALTAIIRGVAVILFLAPALRAEPGIGIPSLPDAECDAQTLATDEPGEESFADPSCLGRRECGEYYGSCLPRWTVDANALFLTRRVSSTPLLTDFATGTELLSASTTDLSSHPGVDIGLIRHWDCGKGIEFRYAGVDRWNAQALVPTRPGDLLRINTGVPLFVATGTAIDAGYASQWHSFEFNGRHELCQQRLNLLAGFRYVELDEEWGFTLVDAAPPFRLETATRNRLYGFQLGGQAVLWDRGGRLSLDAVGKAGIYGNCAAQDSLLVTAAFPSSDARTSTAFLSELGLTGKFRITEGLSVRGGYQLLWINGVALAPEQLAVRDVFGRGIDTSGEAFFHGAFVGLEYAR